MCKQIAAVVHPIVVYSFTMDYDDELYKNGDDSMKKNLVVLGGGYGGLAIIEELLQKGLPKHIAITLIDRQPFQGLKTEYYALAAGTSSDCELRVAFPKSPDVQLVLGEISSLDQQKKLVYVDGHDPISYDYLVIGLGSTDHYHGVLGAEQFSYGIQTFQAARKAYTALNNVEPYGAVTIVGGGLSGVEMASELRESRPDLNISLMNRGPRLLGGFPEGIQTYVADWLNEHQVQLLLNTQLERIEQQTLHILGSPKPLHTDITLWTAGIQPVPLVQQLQAEKDTGGRLKLNKHYQLLNDPAIFVVGDCASLPFSPSAQVAGIQGEHIAHILLAIWREKSIPVETIKLRGTLGALGKHCGFGVMGSMAIKGRVPRLIKSGILWRSKHF